MNMLKKTTSYPASQNYSRKVDYRPMGTTVIERRNGWNTYSLSKVSAASRARLHKVITEQGGPGQYKTGYGNRVYYFK